MDNVRGASGMGEDWFGVTIRGRNGPPRRRTFRITDILPRLHQRFDGVADWGIHRRRQLVRSWRSAISEEEKAANPDQHREGRAREEAEIARTYCGLALEDSAEGSGDNHVGVPVPYPHGGFVHVSCMLERADRLARGYTDPRSCVVCSREGREEDDPPTRRNLLGAYQ